MKAIYFEKGGTSEVLQYGEKNTLGPCSKSQVLVRIKAAGVNPVDCKIRATPDRFPVSFPVIPGCDGAGIVEGVGEKVKTLTVGDAVYFSQPGFNRRQGTYAEYVLVDEALLALKPRLISYEQAAAAPLVLITAWEALHGRARISAGQTVLIHAGAGGVGHVAIQLARLAGARVITTVSNDEKAEFVKRLGADKTINYKTEDVSEAVMRWTGGGGVDIVLDTVGPPELQNCFGCVKPYGDVVTLLQPAADTDWREARLRNLRFSFELMLTPVILELDSAKRHQKEILQRCAALMEKGELNIEIAKLFSLAEAVSAHDYLEKQHPVGKVVLTVESSGQ
ncbi:NADPH2:quinone reductase [Nitrosomonas sp. Nm51]|uniref:zinc-dependent alcohol dehydrogenase family protein n=1 Tax=Nitrosomonas sp. Nm51 TaxID=133720 RepID=UPI0008B01D3A|nr:zinc-dependent alcohol dehydrogenase family protein [Nitrosomonas sp. Nm51]SER44805.1 NADPH2:quinone reductase [Nitrosomonas sp. Nm51]